MSLNQTVYTKNCYTSWRNPASFMHRPYRLLLLHLFCIRRAFAFFLQSHWLVGYVVFKLHFKPLLCKLFYQICTVPQNRFLFLHNYEFLIHIVCPAVKEKYCGIRRCYQMLHGKKGNVNSYYHDKAGVQPDLKMNRKQCSFPVMKSSDTSVCLLYQKSGTGCDWIIATRVLAKKKKEKLSRRLKETAGF